MTFIQSFVNSLLLQIKFFKKIFVKIDPKINLNSSKMSSTLQFDFDIFPTLFLSRISNKTSRYGIGFDLFHSSSSKLFYFFSFRIGLTFRLSGR